MTINNGLVQPVMETVRRTLELFMLFDCSGSMAGRKIAAANQAVRESINELKTNALQYPGVDYHVRCIAFDDDARWHIGPAPADLRQLSWTDLKIGGYTETGAAVGLLADSIRMANMPERGLPPVMVLISDGGNTDGDKYDKAIDQLNREPWGNKAIRLSIGIGDDYDREQLGKFTNHPEIGVLEARSAVDLANYIRYATVTASITASQSASGAGELATTNVILPPPPPSTDSSNFNLQVF